MTEYLIVLGLVGIGALTAFRAYGGAITENTERATQVVATFKGTANCQGGLCTFGNCFVAGTLVATPDGLRPIETIADGDAVLSADEKTGARSVEHVAHTFVRTANGLVDLHVANADGASDVVRSTPEHPYWAKGRGWVLAGDLHAGDVLEDEAGSPLEVTAKDDVAASAQVFNFEVEGTHTYFVGKTEAWVHNANCGANGSASGARPLPPTYPADESELPPALLVGPMPTSVPPYERPNYSRSTDHPVSWFSPTGAVRNAAGLYLRAGGEATRLVGRATGSGFIEGAGVIVNSFGFGAQGYEATADNQLQGHFEEHPTDEQRLGAAQQQWRNQMSDARRQQEQYNRRSTGAYAEQYSDGHEANIDQGQFSHSAAFGQVNMQPPVNPPVYSPPDTPPYEVNTPSGHTTTAQPPPFTPYQAPPPRDQH